MTEMPDELLESIRELSSFLISEETLPAALDRVAKLSRSGIPGVDGAGITLVTDEEIHKRTYKVETAAYSDDKVLEIDKAQYDTKEGPCLQAIEDAEVYLIDDLKEETRWPRFRELAFKAGLRSSLSLPLVVGGRALGALNLYSYTEHGFAEEDVDLGRAFASQAAITLANIEVYQGALELSNNLNRAMQSRAVIEQAKGMVMMQRQCNSDEAFQTLVAASQARNKKLRDIAEEVVEAASAGNLEGPIQGH